VVDLGTGSGVLGFSAARPGSGRPRARDRARADHRGGTSGRALANGIHNVVFHRVHSSAFEVPEGADVILHEQIGVAMFDERVVENVAELRDRILKPGGCGGADGVLDGLCVYFSAGFDPERWFTSSPAESPTSWGSPLQRVEQRPAKSRRHHRGHGLRGRSRLPGQLDVGRRSDGRPNRGAPAAPP
jgi:hypothetical protein